MTVQVPIFDVLVFFIHMSVHAFTYCTVCVCVFVFFFCRFIVMHCAKVSFNCIIHVDAIDLRISGGSQYTTCVSHPFHGAPNWHETQDHGVPGVRRPTDPE